MNYEPRDMGVVVEIIALDFKILIALAQDTKNVSKIWVCWSNSEFSLMTELGVNTWVFTMIDVFLCFQFLTQKNQGF